MRSLVTAACLVALCPGSALAATVFGVDEKNNLVSFDSSSPATLLSSIALTGPAGGFRAIDFRPLNNVLYGLGADSVVYTINIATGMTTAVSAGLAISGGSFGFDFNPTIDRVRIVSDTNNNYVFNPNDGSLTGAPTTTSLAYGAGDANMGKDPNVEAAAYTTSVFGAAGTTTQLYVLDTGLDVLAKQNNNGGVLTTVGKLGANLGKGASFDIAGSEAFAYSGKTLYGVNLDTGKLTKLGNTGMALVGISAAAVPEPSTWAMMIAGFGAVGFALRRRREDRRQIA